LLKVVIDTNIFVSSVLTEGGNPSLLIKAWKRTRKYQLFVTEEIIQEILRVMERLNVNPDIVTGWDKTIRKNAIQIVPARKIEVIREDPSDNKFLECAVESHADYIVTGDKHLKRLDEFEGIKIVNAGKFLNILKRYNKIIIEPQIIIPKDQAYFYTPEWQREEKEAHEDIKKGRVTKTEGLKELFRQLDL